MKIVTVAIAASVLFVGYCLAQSMSGGGGSIEIVEYLDSGETESCAGFRVPEDVILKHLQEARSATARDYADDLHSPCKVSGVLQTAEGRSDFVLQSSGVAMLSSDGKDVFVFGEPSWTDPYAGGYGNED